MPQSFRQDFAEAIDAVREADRKHYALTRMIESYPALAWAKRWNGETWVMEILSNGYLRDIMGDDASDYVGKSDHDFWPKEVADAFKANDDAAWEGGAMLVRERFAYPRTGRAGTFYGWKWPFEVNEDRYVAGIGIVEGVAG